MFSRYGVLVLFGAAIASGWWMIAIHGFGMAPGEQGVRASALATVVATALAGVAGLVLVIRDLVSSGCTPTPTPTPDPPAVEPTLARYIVHDGYEEHIILAHSWKFSDSGLFFSPYSSGACRVYFTSWRWFMREDLCVRHTNPSEPPKNDDGMSVDGIPGGTNDPTSP